MAGPTQPQPFRWTVEQYRDLAKTGQFRDAKTMFIDGEVYVVVMPKPPHDFASGLTDDWLRTAFAVGHHFRKQMGFVVGTAPSPSPISYRKSGKGWTAKPAGWGSNSVEHSTGRTPYAVAGR